MVTCVGLGPILVWYEGIFFCFKVLISFSACLVWLPSFIDLLGLDLLTFGGLVWQTSFSIVSNIAAISVTEFNFLFSPLVTGVGGAGGT